MALPSSGQLSFSAIANELSVSLSNVSLRSMSNTAGFSTPDAVSDFYGYSAVTYTFVVYAYANNPCDTNPYNIYLGSNGNYYANNGSGYVLINTVSSNWYVYSYFDDFMFAYIYNYYISTNTSFTYQYDDFSFCPPS